MVEELAWKVPVVVAELPESGQEFDLVPDEAARTSLARYAGVNAVRSLVARLHVQPDGRGGAAVQGTMQATVNQTCVVTLEPFDNPIVEGIAMRFAPPGALAADAAGSIDIAAEDPPDPLSDGALDLAAVVAEFLMLAADPYPRKPGAVFAPPGQGEGRGKDSPFAPLEGLKGRLRGEKG